MKTLIPTIPISHRLIDSGNGSKLEQFGSATIIRADKACLWNKNKDASVWDKAHALCRSHDKGTWLWETPRKMPEPWRFTAHLTHIAGQPTVNGLVRLSQSKNIGVFPEQAVHWEWMTKIIAQKNNQPAVLNLFAYTGMASLCAAASGASVCHVDSSNSAVSWARQNQKMSGLEQAPIRWIVDDCADFVGREIKRGSKYDALIFDPPAFGRSSKGAFHFEKQTYALLKMCAQLLPEKPLFVLFNGYAMGHSPLILKNILDDIFPGRGVELGELCLEEADSKRLLPCSIFARFSNSK